MTGKLHEDEFTFLIVSRPVLHRMINVSDKPCRENQKKQFVFSNFFPKIAPFRRLCKKKNTVQPSTAQITILHMRIACWIPEATNTHSEYVILIAFPLQQWLQERQPLLRYACIPSLV